MTVGARVARYRRFRTTPTCGSLIGSSATRSSVGRLGRMMLDEGELPHDNLRLLFPFESA